MIEALGKKLHVTLLLLVIGVGIVLVGIDVVASDQGGISLQDIRQNPENYLEVEENGIINLGARMELYAEFTIVKITLRPDPYNQLWETYYLVYINDTFGYEIPFVISEDALLKYEENVGETVLFKLHFHMGHGLVPPAHFLITNILAVKDIGYVHIYVSIFLAEPISLEDVVNYPENYLAPRNDPIRHNDFYAEFTIVSVSEPVTIVDWYGMEWEICIVMTKDSYDYELPFYISSDDYQNYTLWIGKSAPFKLSVGDGPYYESWSFALLINRIAYKPHDNYGAAYSVYIYLAEPASFEVSNLLISPTEVLTSEPVSVSVNVTNIGEVEGTYPVTLKINGAIEETREVTLAGGATETVTFTVTRDVAGTYGIEVNGQSGTIRVMAVLEADAGPDQTVGVGTTVTFNASVSRDPDGTIVSYVWDFGDGSNGTGVTTTHTYTEPGTYSVTLTVRDAAGNSDADTVTVTVEEIAAEGFPWWIAGIVGVIVVAGIAPVALTLRRRRGGKLQETGVVTVTY